MVAIHPGLGEPAPPVELTTEALQARWSCASSLETFIKSKCAAEDSRSEVGFQVCLDCGCPRLQLTFTAWEVVFGRRRFSISRNVLQHDWTNKTFIAISLTRRIGIYEWHRILKQGIIKWNALTYRAVRKRQTNAKCPKGWEHGLSNQQNVSHNIYKRKKWLALWA